MLKYDFYTGEPDTVGSPSELSQQEIVNNANLVSQNNYYFDPQQRLNQQPQPFYPSAYNNGYGYNQPYQQQLYQYNPQQPSGFQGYVGNPAFQYMQNNGMGMYQQPIQKTTDYTYYVPGFSTGSNMLLSADAEDVCAQLQMDMFKEQEEAYAARMEKQQSYYKSLGYTNGPNYYGTPYVNNNTYDPAITNKYRGIVDDMRREATEARSNLNRSLSRLCQYYLNDGDVNEEYIDEIYTGHYVTVPGQQIEDYSHYQRLASCVEYDSSEMYRQHSAAVSAEYRNVFTDDNVDMNTFLQGLGEVIANEKLEEEKHKRRDASGLYRQDGTYKELIRAKVQERYNRENGITPEFNLPNLTTGQANIPMGQAFPTLNQSAKMLDDGTLQISAPAWLGNKQYAIRNTMEDEYEKNKQRFINSIYGNDLPGGVQNGS